MNAKRLAFFTAVAILVLATLACDLAATPMPYSGELHAQAEALERQAQAMAVEETRVAEITRTAQDVAARATSDAQTALERQIAIDATATAVKRQADADATATLVQATAVQATATRVALDATATTTREIATAQALAEIQRVEKTVIAATAQHVDRQDKKEQSTQLLTTFGGWAILLIALVLAFFVGRELLPVLIDRLRVIRRKADEGEPIVMMERDPETGRERIALPLRSFYALLTAGKMPDDEWQDRASARQQLANVVQAQAQGSRRRVRRLPPGQGQQSVLASPSIRVVEPDEVRPWIEDVRGQLLEEVS